MCVLAEGPSKKILASLALHFIMDPDSHDCDVWKITCHSRGVLRFSILHWLVFVLGNCLIANKVKNYNAIVACRGIEKCKFINLVLNILFYLLMNCMFSCILSKCI